MPFPDLDMVPEDQRTCVPDTKGNRHVGNDGPGSKFLYFEFINEDKGWPESTAYHCLINQPIGVLLTPTWKKFGPFQRIGKDSYGQVDSDGCSTVSEITYLSNVYNPDGYCYTSPPPNPNAFPLGSF